MTTHTTDPKTVPSVHLHLYRGQLKPRPSPSAMKRSGNMPQATLDMGRFHWKVKLLFTRPSWRKDGTEVATQ